MAGSAGKRVGVLTGGGDCPGLNAVVRGVTRTALAAGWEVVGLKNGWRGLVQNITVPLTMDSVSGILHRGGTILGSSRTNPYQRPEDAKQAVANYKALGLNALIAIGGEDTLGVGVKLIAEGLHVIGVPKTIDNDLSRTDYTFGFDTAVNIAMEAIDRLHTTAESHHRIMVCEVMGRHAGWIATCAGIAGGADAILIPEQAIDVDEVVGVIRKRHSRGKEFSIVVVAEGAVFKDPAIQKEFEDENVRLEPEKATKRDAFGHIKLGGIGQFLSTRIERATGFETRVTVLGHIQRGGSPTAFDRILGTRFGVKAMELAIAGTFGRMVSLQGTRIVDAPLDKDAVAMKRVDPELSRIASVFFG